MSRTTIAGAIVILLLAVFAGLGESASEEQPVAEGTNATKAEECIYVGVKKCAFCHVRLDDSLRTWAITKHANALAVLRTPKARKFSDTPDEDPKCLKCHMTGTTSDPHAAEGVLPVFMDERFEGVQCEMCHGPGSLYKAEMARALPKDEELDEQQCTRRGLVIPTEQTCRKCHNEECPVFEGFNFEEAVKRIKHSDKEAKCEYIGQETCAFCHVKADESAATWVILKHINAFSVLKTKLAQKFSKDPLHDERCLECHSTGLNQPGGYDVSAPSSQKLEGVQCEMCHGWGYSYVETMAKAKILNIHNVRDECFRHGLVIPDKEVCLRCHNERCPVYTGFDFEESLKQIKHGDALRMR
jgi:hypothetical protein